MRRQPTATPCRSCATKREGLRRSHARAFQGHRTDRRRDDGAFNIGIARSMHVGMRFQTSRPTTSSQVRQVIILDTNVVSELMRRVRACVRGRAGSIRPRERSLVTTTINESWSCGWHREAPAEPASAGSSTRHFDCALRSISRRPRPPLRPSTPQWQRPMAWRRARAAGRPIDLTDTQIAGIAISRRMPPSQPAMSATSRTSGRR